MRQRINLGACDIPDAPRVGAEIFMDNPVAHARDRAPGDVGVGGLDARGNVFRGLSHDGNGI